MIIYSDYTQPLIRKYILTDGYNITKYIYTWFFLLFCQWSFWSWWIAERLNWAAGCPTPPEYTEEKKRRSTTCVLVKTSMLVYFCFSPPLGSRCVSSELGAPDCQGRGDGAPPVYRWSPAPYWLKSQAGSSWSWGSRQTPDPPTGQRRGEMEDGEENKIKKLEEISHSVIPALFNRVKICEKWRN